MTYTKMFLLTKGKFKMLETYEGQVVSKPKNKVVERQPKWSDKVLYWITDYETFVKLKKIHKWYHQNLHDIARWKRWKLKTVNQKGEAPKYCPHFLNLPGWSRQHWSDYFFWQKCLDDKGMIAAFQTARMPFENKEDAENAEIPSKKEINSFYKQLNEYFEG